MDRDDWAQVSVAMTLVSLAVGALYGVLLELSVFGAAMVAVGMAALSLTIIAVVYRLRSRFATERNRRMSSWLAQ
jgi:uncharacterized membrane protein YoaK (UPF0700 family)